MYTYAHITCGTFMNVLPTVDGTLHVPKTTRTVLDASL